MENGPEDGGVMLAATAEVTAMITRIVNERVEAFKQQLDLELMPLRLTVQSLEMQFGLVKESQAASMSLLARLEGKTDTFIQEMRVNHAENQKRDERLTELFHAHMGEHAGREHTEETIVIAEERSADSRRKWIGLILSGLGASGAAKYVHDNWSKIFHHH